MVKTGARQKEMQIRTGGPRGAAWVQNAAPDESGDSVPLPAVRVNYALCGSLRDGIMSASPWETALDRRSFP